MIKRILNLFKDRDSAAPTEKRHVGIGSGFPTILGNSSVVNSENINGIPAAIACIRVIAETVATLPLHLYKEDSNGNKQHLSNHPVAQVLLRKPNNYMTCVQFIEAMMYQVLVHGNAYAQIRYKRNGKIHDLYPLYPQYMQVTLDEQNEELRYLYRGKIALTQKEVLHIRGLSGNGITGISPLEAARNVLELGMNLDEQASAFFKNGAMPGGVLEHPGRLSEDAARNLRESWTNAYTGSRNAFKTAILEEGISYKPLMFNSRDSQLLESRQFQLTEIARIYRVPPHMIQDLSRATFSNIEAQSIDFVRHTIRPWLVRLESTLNQVFFSASTDTYVEFKADAILRGDTNTRYSAYSIGLQNGFLSVNEVRRLENLNTLDNDSGDVFYRPLNMQIVKKDGTIMNGQDNATENNVDQNSIQSDQVRSQVLASIEERFGSKIGLKMLSSYANKKDVLVELRDMMSSQNFINQLNTTLKPLNYSVDSEAFTNSILEKVAKTIDISSPSEERSNLEELSNLFKTKPILTNLLKDEQCRIPFNKFPV